MKAALITIIVIACTLFTANELMTNTEKINVTVVMGSGSTLWNEVGDAMSSTGDNRDIREVIYNTRRLNGIDNAGKIPIGTVLVIPCEVVK